MKSYEILCRNKLSGQAVVSARMSFPPLRLSGLVFTMIERDTRDLDLGKHQRFNYFPVSPLCSVVWVLKGESHLIVDANIPPQDNPALPDIAFLGPFNKPFASWSPGPLHSVCISFYPESWAKLTGRRAGDFLNKAVPANAASDGAVLAGLNNLASCETGLQVLENFDQSLGIYWKGQRPASAYTLSDWIKGLAVRTAMSGTGQSLRQMQRRIKSWTGGSRRTLEKTARMETLHREIMQRQKSDQLSLASLAHDLGYADQSHMGREFRNMTGMSPQKIGRLSQTDENYWCYRLLGERFK